MKRRVVPGGATLDRDVVVRMRDGTRLMANVFRPPGERPVPVVMSVTPYGKDTLPDRIGMTFMRFAGVRFGRLECPRWTGFESPDPMFWTAAGYAVGQADVRGNAIRGRVASVGRHPRAGRRSLSRLSSWP
jgi:predicted acyl esterase